MQVFRDYLPKNHDCCIYELRVQVGRSKSNERNDKCINNETHDATIVETGSVCATYCMRQRSKLSFPLVVHIQGVQSGRGQGWVNWDLSDSLSAWAIGNLEEASFQAAKQDGETHKAKSTPSTLMSTWDAL